LPAGRGDKRLKAHPADDLFERRVVAIWRDKECAHRDLVGIVKVLAGQPAKPQSRARRRLKQQCADVRLLLALAPQLGMPDILSEAGGHRSGVLEMAEFGTPCEVAAVSAIIATAPTITSTMPIQRSARS
jgi:hypothetical protein